jgi:hypothetical protein
MGLTKPRAAQIFNLDYKQSTRVVTTVSVSLTGGAPSSVDGVSLSVGDRVLVTGQTTGSQNGLYYVVTVGSGTNGTWARTSDGNENGEIEAGMIVMVTEGVIYADTQWKLITDDPIVVGTTTLTYTQNYSANSITGGSSNVRVFSNANVTISSAGTANVLTVSSTGVAVLGQITSGNVTGGNANITGTTAATSKTTGALTVAGGVGVASDVWAGNSVTVDGGAYGNVVTTQFASVFASGSGPNPRSIMQVRGADAAAGIGIQGVSGGNGQIYANTGIIFTTGATLRDKDFPTGGTTRATLDANGLAVTGAVSATGNITGGNILTGGLISVTGNVTGNYFLGNVFYANGIYASRIFNGTSEANIGASGGNANISIGGTSNVVVFATTGEYVTGLLSVTGNITSGNISATNHTGTNVSVTGTVTAASTVGGVITGSSSSVTGTVTAASTVGGVITGTSVSVTGTVTGASVVGGIITGTSTSVTGNVTGGNISTVGLITAIGNVYTGNILTNGYYYANGAVFGGGGGGTPGGSNTYVQFNDNGAFNGSAGFTFNKTTNAIATTGAISTTGAVTGASVVGGVITGSSVSVSGIVTGASVVGGVITGSSVSVTGAVSGASAAFSGASTAGSYSATGTVTGGNIATAGQLTVNSGANVIAIVNGATTGVGNIGSSTVGFNTVFAKATTAQYADLAEMYCADAPYAPGTVVEFGGSHEITITNTTHSTQVAGIISTQPAYLMNSTQVGEHPLEVALVGRVPCSVVGTVRKGDRLVSSTTPGVAQALDINLYQPGCIVGKALEEYDSAEPGVIEVAVGRS